MQGLTCWKRWDQTPQKTLHHNEYNYSVDSLLFFTPIRERYVRIYERFIVELKSYSKAIRILSKDYLPITLITPSKLEAILEQVKLILTKTNKDYNLVFKQIVFIL